MPSEEQLVLSILQTATEAYLTPREIGKRSGLSEQHVAGAVIRLRDRTLVADVPTRRPRWITLTTWSTSKSTVRESPTG